MAATEVSPLIASREHCEELLKPNRNGARIKIRPSLSDATNNGEHIPAAGAIGHSNRDAIASYAVAALETTLLLGIGCGVSKDKTASALHLVDM